MGERVVLVRGVVGVGIGLGGQSDSVEKPSLCSRGAGAVPCIPGVLGTLLWD